MALEETKDPWLDRNTKDHINKLIRAIRNLELDNAYLRKRVDELEKRIELPLFSLE